MEGCSRIIPVLARRCLISPPLVGGIQRCVCVCVGGGGFFFSYGWIYMEVVVLPEGIIMYF